MAELGDLLRRTLAKGFGHQFDEADLDDLRQETLMRIHAKLDDFAGRSRFTTWAAAIAVNQALMELRRRKHKGHDLDDAVAAGHDALAPREAEALHIRERNALLRASIDRVLSEKQRRALLAELGGLPSNEIARQMQTTRGAVYKLVHDARKRLLADFRSQGLNATELLATGDQSHG